MSVSRRTTIGLGATGALVAAAGGAWFLNDRHKIRASNKIDTHHHFLPKVYVDAVGLADLASVMPNRVAPAWSPELALAMMEQRGIAEGILSISSGPRIPNAPVLLRQCNEAAAALRAQHPGRFGSFASLPLPDIDASLKEVGYAFETLKADGVILFTNYDGKYLGDSAFAPLMEELDRRKAVAFIHPNHPPYDLAGLPPASVLEFPFDTTRTAASLIMAGALKRWPDIKFILSHAGGTLPFLSQRMMGAVMINPDIAERVGDVPTAIKSFWFDTALSMSKPAIAALTAVADPGRILFGSDFPMAPPKAVEISVTGLAHAPIGDTLRADIGRANAARLLGRPAVAAIKG